MARKPIAEWTASRAGVPPTPHEVSIHPTAFLSVRYRVTNISPSVTFPSLRQPRHQRDSRRTGITPECERERLNARYRIVCRADWDWRRASAVAGDWWPGDAAAT